VEDFNRLLWESINLCLVVSRIQTFEKKTETRIDMELNAYLPNQPWGLPDFLAPTGKPVVASLSNSKVANGSECPSTEAQLAFLWETRSRVLDSTHDVQNLGLLRAQRLSLKLLEEHEAARSRSEYEQDQDCSEIDPCL